MVFFLNCYQITIEKLFAKITTVYKKPQGILLKLTLENLEISGNFVGNWVDTLHRYSSGRWVHRYSSGRWVHRYSSGRWAHMYISGRWVHRYSSGLVGT